LGDFIAVTVNGLLTEDYEIDLIPTRELRNEASGHAAVQLVVFDMDSNGAIRPRRERRAKHGFRFLGAESSDNHLADSLTRLTPVLGEPKTRLDGVFIERVHFPFERRRLD
jgi:hypothetical protein